MGRKPHPQHTTPRPPSAPQDQAEPAGEEAQPSAEGAPVGEELAVERGPSAAAAGAVAGGALVEGTGEAQRRLEQEAAEWRDRALRAAAELENFKKRAARERTELWGRAQGDLITRALDALDDLGRIAALDPVQTNAQAQHEGAGLVERKLMKALEAVGLERVDPAGQAFDPNLHEAVMTAPAPAPQDDHKVGSVFQPGYRLNGVLLRPARVAVLTWTEPPAAAER